MALTHGLGTTGASATVTTTDHKVAQNGLIVKGGGAGSSFIRAGVFWDGADTLVTGTAGMAYSVRAFTAVLSRSATKGAIPLSNSGAVSVTTTAAPGSNSRIDSVIVWHPEVIEGDANSEPVFVTVNGTASASPTAPSLSAYPGAILLANITVPSGVTATNSGTTIVQTAPFTAAAGGIVYVRNSTERGAGTWTEGQIIYRGDTDVLEKYDGSTWTPVAPVITDSGAIVATLLASWTAYGAPYAAPSYRTKGGTVELFGVMKDGTTANTIFTLPVGSRPLATRQFPAASPSGLAYVNVAANGTVQVTAYGSGGSNAAVTLDGISFFAEQ